MPADENRVIPFGKYKGQPLTVLRRDQDYLDWCAAQEGIRNRYPWIFSVTVNNGVEPAETPEHNRYQALFLDDAFATRFYDMIWPDYRESVARDGMTGRMLNWRDGSGKECAGPVIPVQVQTGFEVNGQDRDGIGRYRTYGPADVQISVGYSVLRIEIKPVMGDDFPAVLRQMAASKCNILYLVAYTGVGATLEQVRKMFKTAGIRVVMHYEFWSPF